MIQNKLLAALSLTVLSGSALAADEPAWTSSLWLNSFGYNAGGWRVEQHPRILADVNGDGLDDIVGFAHSGVVVATSTGSGFNAPYLWVEGYGYKAGGWRIGVHPRMMADVNGQLWLQRGSMAGRKSPENDDRCQRRWQSGCGWIR
ncbi:VCBS repeat-containing protein [Vibrio quintilis]|uniref:FG-GAP repeat protein n=1 Tax=Vibrio quintilis TaxID=1117707 RepID=A0A1M7YVE6_9VIBR|nr:VCBS repeat-containing protein [Vibrio quintilis]SHO56657.1 hypothetical protein VQ7734_02426 [Vibrio quintilis]